MCKHACNDCPMDDTATTPSDLYEVHITVKIPSDKQLYHDKSYFVSNFVINCNGLGGKAVYLDLSVAEDLMYTGRINGDINTVKSKTEVLITRLACLGYNVIRYKVETVMNNPVIDQYRAEPFVMFDLGGDTIADGYYETHIAVATDDNQLLRKWMQSEYEFLPKTHVSKNMLKAGVTMMTMRSPCTLERHEHLSHVQDVTNALSGGGWYVTKVMNEFVLFDSNLIHDNDWTSQ